MEKLELNSEIYSIDAVRKTSYEYWAECETTIDKIGTKIFVCFNASSDIAKHFSKFNKKLTDNQLRIDVLNRTRRIRELIIAQAFAPIENFASISMEIASE